MPLSAPRKAVKNTEIINWLLCAFDGADMVIDWVKSNEMDCPAM